MQAETALEGLLKRDRLLVLSGVAALVALAWAYLVYVALLAGYNGPIRPGTETPRW